MTSPTESCPRSPSSPRRGTAAPSRHARSSRMCATAASACSGPSASQPPACCRGPCRRRWRCCRPRRRCAWLWSIPRVNSRWTSTWSWGPTGLKSNGPRCFGPHASFSRVTASCPLRSGRGDDTASSEATLMAATKTALVVSAHSADFVWRAGGAIALHAALGYHVRVVCLSFGERGESAKLWKSPDMTLEQVKDNRRREAQAAAAILGCEVVFLDVGDYPLRASDEVLYALVDHHRELRPAFVLTHSLSDPYNFDHAEAARVTLQARIVAQAHGHHPGQPALGAPPVFLLEPHQRAQCN